MANLVQLEQKLLAHHLQSAHFSRILLLRQKDLAVAALSNLCEDLEVSLPQPSPPLAEISSLSSKILIERLIVFVLRGSGRCGVLSLELGEAVLARVHVGEQIVVIVEEVCCVSPCPNYTWQMTYRAALHWRDA